MKNLLILGAVETVSVIVFSTIDVVLSKKIRKLDDKGHELYMEFVEKTLKEI